MIFLHSGLCSELRLYSLQTIANDPNGLDDIAAKSHRHKNRYLNTTHVRALHSGVHASLNTYKFT